MVYKMTKYESITIDKVKVNELCETIANIINNGYIISNVSLYTTLTNIETLRRQASKPFDELTPYNENEIRYRISGDKFTIDTEV